MRRSWTNLRDVPDESSSTGWKLDVGAFPGWANLPGYSPVSGTSVDASYVMAYTMA